MATSVIPMNAQFSDAAEHRNTIYSQAMYRLQHLAWRALNVLGKGNGEIVIICIQVDSRWRATADHLMPNHDWDSIRAQGVEPIARGMVAWSVCEMVAEEFPDIASAVLEVPPEGKVKAIVLNDGGCTIYELEPKESLV